MRKSAAGGGETPKGVGDRTHTLQPPESVAGGGASMPDRIEREGVGKAHSSEAFKSAKWLGDGHLTHLIRPVTRGVGWCGASWQAEKRGGY
ncbi:hypothetical protein ES705_27828 [subsurface metagenome]